MTPVIRLMLVFASAIGYLALAVLGWGGPSAFFSHPALVGLSMALFGLTVLAYLAGGNLSAGVREDRDNRWVIAALAIIGIASAYLPAWSDRHEFWTFGGNAARWLGVALFALGGVLRVWPVYVLGNRFSGLVAIQPGHRLMTEGIYASIRNPSYLGLLISSFGWGLAFRSVLGLLLAALMIPPLIARIHSEEKLLASEFGAEYDAYRVRTSRLIPGLY
jgi:protein-S-isoprenylcysteine O-methyltransferase Ste14